MIEQISLRKSDLVLLIGSTLAIVGVFITWANISMGSGFYSETVNVSGWTFISDGIASQNAMFYAPLVLLAMSLCSYAALVLKRILPGQVARLSAAMGLLSIAGFVMTVLFAFELSSMSNMLGGLIGYEVGSGIGLYVGLIACLVTLGASALSVKEAMVTEEPETDAGRCLDIDVLENEI